MSDLAQPPSAAPKKSPAGIIALVVVLALVVIGVGGWFGACAIATKKAKEGFDAVYKGTPLEGMVTYDDLSATPFGDVTIKGITMTSPEGNPDGVITVERVDVSVSKGDDGLSGKMDVAISGMYGTLENLAAFNDQPLSDYDELRELGYEALDLDATFSVSNDHEKGETAMAITLDLKDAMSFGFSFQLTGTDLSGMEDLRQLESLPENQREKAARKIGEKVVFANIGAKLAALSADMDIEDLYQRATAKKGGLTDRERQAAESVDPALFMMAGQSPEDAQKSAQAIKKLILEGKALHLRTDIEKPIPFLTITQRDGPETFAKALGFTLSN